MEDVKTINLRGVNCFLLKSGEGFILIDTGLPARRAELERELESAGCRPGDLRLVILTHGDYDHAGNGAYLREKYGVKIAMHHVDSPMVERGDEASNRKDRPDRVSPLGRIIIPIGKLMTTLCRMGKLETFKPDLCLDDGQSLAEYGLDARVLHLPGHSKGSIGVLTADGGLFCGDLLMNMRRPDAHFMIDDLAGFHASIEKLKSPQIQMVYPGHGKPFPMSSLPPL